ncbi:biotin--[acetyl-CoA-carboxylase] ligase [Flavimarina sp. Hel_I_48]|uniref:biotin--[acetyl-CoA-carboxylase] ligase n=1 Tax=Flavimarina sp. Hel_I_48 TaxID=1392488 RepID=UPI0004DFC727|nr:biotin--[acetyl-CoA-carboxylase] ligase [Flavimarina sp. Hel_I_48]
MRTVKVDATASTNSYLREFSRSMDLQEEILLWTDHQFAGRGQRGATWESQPFKNLTFSVFKRVRLFPVEKQFYITMAASLAIVELLKEFEIPRLKVKWPNDILAGNRKLCGILIESVVKNGKLDALIIGVGLNVNQTHFERAPQATSLALETKKEFELAQLIKKINPIFEKYVNRITRGDFEQIKVEYEAELFKKDRPALFSNPNGDRFNGMIKGVSEEGKLLLQHEDDAIRKYGLKELKMLY